MRRAARGMTLVELLIALALLGLLMLVLFAGMRIGTRSWDSAESHAENLSLARVLEHFLRTEMSQIIPYRWTSDGKTRLAFSGERRAMRFVAPMPSRLSRDGVSVIALEVEQEGDGSRIVWRYRPLNAQMTGFSALDGVPSHVLVSGISSARVSDIWFSYFGAEQPGAAPRWLDRWDNEQDLPLLIRVQASLTEGREWPDFVVAPAMAR